MHVMWAVVMIGAAVGLLWLARRIEPHWSARDGRSFSCRVQGVSDRGEPLGKWSEARATVDGGRVMLTGTVAGVGGVYGEPRRVRQATDRGERGHAVFLLEGSPALAVRVPATSAAARRLAEITEV